MLLFIQEGSVFMVRDTGISIHLMLLFISGAQEISQLYYNFNTSHVTVYRVWYKYNRMSLVHFNTSHVTVYPVS